MDYQQVFQVKNEGSWQGRSAQSLLCAPHRCSDLRVSVPVHPPLLPSCAEHSTGERVSTAFPWQVFRGRKRTKAMLKAWLKCVVVSKQAHKPGKKQHKERLPPIPIPIRISISHHLHLVPSTYLSAQPSWVWAQSHDC